MDAFLFHLMIAITDLGDSAVLGALVIAVSSCLMAQDCSREAKIFLLSFVAASLSIGVIKVVIIGCGSPLRALGLHSPSGHTALSVVIYGDIALLLRSPNAKYRHRINAFMSALVFSIAASRVILGAHSVIEVITGACVGAVILAITAKLFIRKPPEKLKVSVIIYVIVIVAFVVHGIRLPMEHIIQLIASHFKQYANC